MTGNRRIWLFLVVVSLLGMVDLVGVAIIRLPLWMQVAGVVSVSVLKATLLTIVMAVSRRSWVWGPVIVCVAVYVALCVANGVIYCLYGFGISNKLLIIVFQTNKREVLEFLPGMGSNLVSVISSFRFWIWVVGLSIIFMAIRYVPGRLWIIATLSCSLAGAGILVAYITMMKSGRTGMLVSLRFVKAIRQAREEDRHLRELMANMRPFPYPERVTYDADSLNVILVIGESASRRHLSVYGYPLPTSPGMDSISGNLYLFSDAIASSTSTAGNMERILGFMPDNDSVGSWADYPLLVDLYNAAGYKSYWLSNQERAGIWGNASGVMANNADVVNYTSSESGDDALLMRYDGVLLPAIEKAISDSSPLKFIGVHLLGSHMLYSSRYPEEFGFFTEEDVLNIAKHRKWVDKAKAATIAHYDNSIRYTDSIICRIIELAGNCTWPTVVMYFSDHGENVYDDKDFIGRDEKSVEVPFVIYVNDSYRLHYPGLCIRIEESEGLRFSTANVIHPLMTISGISYPLYDATLDFLSTDFVERKRYVDNKVWKYEKDDK